MPNQPALIVVDLQRYYLDPKANFRLFPQSKNPSAFDYIDKRCKNSVIPNVKRLLVFFRKHNWPVIYLRLCGQNPDRSDLHDCFRSANEAGVQSGYPGLYPLADEPLAAVHPEIAPIAGEIVLDKVTFSAFTSSDIEDVLLKLGAEELVFCGLATSQCVDTTARDAADRGYPVIHVEDAQADYSEMSHHASLYASQGICGGLVYSTDEVVNSVRPINLVV